MANGAYQLIKDMQKKQEYESEIASLQAELDARETELKLLKRRARLSLFAAAVCLALASLCFSLYTGRVKENRLLKEQIAMEETAHAEN